MIGTYGCPCKEKPWGDAAPPTEETGWESYVPLLAQAYKLAQSTPAFERMVQYEAELRNLIATGARSEKIIEAQAKYNQAKRDVALENEYINQKREAIQLAKLGVLSLYAVGVAGAIYALSRVVK
jgi:hypothetical protein